jgi:CHAD domain-containing protein
MSPGLASFVASGDEYAWDAEVAAALGQLEQTFALLPDPNGGTHGAPHRRRTWFDTFDWRLYRAGLLLEYAPARRGGELLLTSVGDPDQPLARQPVTGWRPTTPHPAADIPDGPLAARIAAIASPRALLPVAAVADAATVTRLLNADGKTVARLVLESPAAVSADRTRLPSRADRTRLPPRLAITEVRGYPGQARRAAQILAQAPGIQPASDTILTAALAALGRRPGDYSNKIGAPVSDTMPAAEAIAVILLRLLDTLEVNVSGVIRDIDTEFLHDLRVSVRRTRAALKLLGDALIAATAVTADELDRFTADFKWLGDLTTPTRDLDVHLLEFARLAAGLAAAEPEDLEPFRSFLQQRRLRASRALGRGLRSPRFGALTAEWRKTLLAVRDAGSIEPWGGAPGRSGTTRELAADRTLRAFRRVARRGGAITPTSPHESLHDLRKRCKELRYVLEFFAPLHDPASYGKVVGDLKRLQDCLGQFQDSEVQIAEIRALAEAMLAADAAPAVTLLAMGEITSGIAARQAAARADFERRFAAFAGTDGQRRMAALLRGGAA